MRNKSFMKKLINTLGIGFILCAMSSCSGCDDPVNPIPGGDLTDIAYNPVEVVIEAPCDFPEMEIPEDNPLTMDGVELGRFLFWDPILSADKTMSCGSCHFPEGGFTDTLAVSTGIDGIEGRRSSMALMNVGYFYNGFFWDGRAATLEDQALLPVEDPIELHHQWTNIVEEFKTHDFYPSMFRKAFGISNTNEITKELAAKAIAQFERTMVSSGQSDYDRHRCEPGFFMSSDAVEGFILFSNEIGNHPGCTHCHTASNQLFTNNNYENNGIDSVGYEVEDLNNFADWGRGEVTNDVFDNGKFRIPSLRNIMLSQPYMHDGRFETIGEVIEHYKTGGFSSANSNPIQQPFPLTEDEKQKIIIFLEALTDATFLNNPAFSDPFD